MKKPLPLLLLMNVFNSLRLQVQTVIDYGTRVNTVHFNYFKSNLDRSLTTSIDNSNPSSINTNTTFEIHSSN